MTQAFLNEPTIELAHQKYLESWTLPTVKAAWKGRRPSLAQFTKRFGEAHSVRQGFLDRTGFKLEGAATAVLDEKRMDDVQEAAEGVHEGIYQRIQELLGELLPPRFAEHEVGDVQEIEAEPAIEVRTVKPENMDALPTAKQLYYYLHRAREAGHSFVTIPTTRGLAARGRSLMAEGESYPSVIVALRKEAKDS